MLLIMVLVVIVTNAQHTMVQTGSRASHARQEPEDTLGRCGLLLGMYLLV